jgi:hypothetical protein
MRPKFVFLSIAMAVAVLASFGLGHWVGKQDGQRQAAAAVDLEARSEGVQKFFIAQKTLKSLQDAKYNDARRILLQYAKLQIRGVRECKASSICARWSGPLMPSDDDLEKVSSMTMPDGDPH